MSSSSRSYVGVVLGLLLWITTWKKRPKVRTSLLRLWRKGRRSSSGNCSMHSNGSLYGALREHVRSWPLCVRAEAKRKMPVEDRLDIGLGSMGRSASRGLAP